jgi:hypothetical protein
MVEGAIADFNTMREACEVLAKRTVDSKTVQQYFESVVPGKATRSVNVRERMTALLDHETNRLPGMAGTLWQAYNAVTYWGQYERPTRGSTDEERVNNRQSSMMFGSGLDLNRDAMKFALELV